MTSSAAPPTAQAFDREDLLGEVSFNLPRHATIIEAEGQSNRCMLTEPKARLTAVLDGL